MASILRNFPEFVAISERLDKLEEMNTQQAIEIERIHDDIKMVLETIEKVSLATKVGFAEIREIVEDYIVSDDESDDEPEPIAKIESLSGYVIGAVSILMFAIAVNVFTYATSNPNKWLLTQT